MAVTEWPLCNIELHGQKGPSLKGLSVGLRTSSICILVDHASFFLRKGTGAVVAHTYLSTTFVAKAGEQWF